MCKGSLMFKPRTCSHVTSDTANKNTTLSRHHIDDLGKQTLQHGHHRVGSLRVVSIRVRSRDGVVRRLLLQEGHDGRPCSVTTTASDDAFSIPTNAPGWNRGSHFPPLAGLAGVCKIFSPNSRIGVLSFRPCSLCIGVFPSLPMSHLFVRYAADSTSQHSIHASGGTPVPMRCSSAAFSVVAWPATSPTARSMIPLE